MCINVSDKFVKYHPFANEPPRSGLRATKGEPRNETATKKSFSSEKQKNLNERKEVKHTHDVTEYKVNDMIHPRSNFYGCKYGIVLTILKLLSCILLWKLFICISVRVCVCGWVRVRDVFNKRTNSNVNDTMRRWRGRKIERKMSQMNEIRAHIQPTQQWWSWWCWVFRWNSNATPLFERNAQRQNYFRQSLSTVWALCTLFGTCEWVFVDRCTLRLLFFFNSR